MIRKHDERCEKCKKTVQNLLATIFNEVEVAYDIDLPARLEGYLGTSIHADIAPIYHALQSYRGHNEFVKANRLQRVDFFIPSRKLIIEFDESQHFTKPREIALGFYSNRKEFGFDIKKWLILSRQLDKQDNDPPYRDEQRAWYDTLRDFAPILWGTGKIIRLYSHDFVWCSLDPEKESDLEIFKKILFNEKEL
jgi:hypothetical protein